MWRTIRCPTSRQLTPCPPPFRTHSWSVFSLLSGFPTPVYVCLHLTRYPRATPPLTPVYPGITHLTDLQYVTNANMSKQQPVEPVGDVVIRYTYPLHSSTLLEEAVQKGTVVVGQLKVYRRWGTGPCFVRSPYFPCDVVINRPQFRGIAMHNDIVAVELLPHDQWSIESAVAADEDEGTAQKMPLSLPDGRRVVRLVATSARDDEKLLPAQYLARQMSAPVTHDWPKGSRPVGRVVHLLSREMDALHVARLCPNVLKPGDAVQSGYGYRFKPYNALLPPMVVHGRDIPPPYHADLPSYLFLLRLKSRGGMLKTFKGDMICATVERVLGNTNSVEANTHAICRTLDTRPETFEDDVEMCVPETLEMPSAAQLVEMGRRDLRQEEFVCTIDPATARDLDDALSVCRTPSGYRVGVHIADVSHFVKPNTPLDDEAKLRSTSTYLVDRVVPMLPRRLCEDYCSLNPSEDKFAFSALFEMNRDAHVVAEWFGPSVIRSRCRLSYEQAQQILDGAPVEVDLEKESAHMGVTTTELSKKVAAAVKLLFEVSSKRRAESLARGRLTIGNSRLGFVFEDMNSKLAPQGFYVSQQIEANWLVEELMLLANARVAEKIVQFLPDSALLRHHLPPEHKKMAALNASVTKRGIAFRGAAAKTLQETLDGARNHPDYYSLCQLMKRSLKRAQYLANKTTENVARSHFALGLPWYTHFTSPIRRYCDVMVHRQLLLALELEQRMQEMGLDLPTAPAADIVAKPGADPFSMETVINPDTLRNRDYCYTLNEVEQIAENCNTTKDNAFRAGEMSIQLFFCLYLQALEKKASLDPRLSREQYTTAVVLNLGEGHLLLCAKEIAQEVEIGLKDTAQSFTVMPVAAQPDNGNNVSRAVGTGEPLADAKTEAHLRRKGGKRNNPQHAKSAPQVPVTLNWGAPPTGGEDVMEAISLFDEVVVRLLVSNHEGMMSLKFIILPPWEREVYYQSGTAIPTSLL